MPPMMVREAEPGEPSGPHIKLAVNKTTGAILDSWAKIRSVMSSGGHWSQVEPLARCAAQDVLELAETCCVLAETVDRLEARLADR